MAANANVSTKFTNVEVNQLEEVQNDVPIDEPVVINEEDVLITREESGFVYPVQETPPTTLEEVEIQQMADI